MTDEQSLEWRKRLCNALSVARNGNTAIVVVPSLTPTYSVVAELASLHASTKDTTLQLRATNDSMHYENTRGQVRVYWDNHPEWNAVSKRFYSYPNVATFIHPELDT
jgi:hypothetical protein